MIVFDRSSELRHTVVTSDLRTITSGDGRDLRVQHRDPGAP